MSETYPRKTFAKHFSQGIFPSSVGIGCKGTTKFADLQEKSHFSAIFYSAGYRRAQDKWRVLGVEIRETGLR